MLCIEPKQRLGAHKESHDPTRIVGGSNSERAPSSPRTARCWDLEVTLSGSRISIAGAASLQADVRAREYSGMTIARESTAQVEKGAGQKDIRLCGPLAKTAGDCELCGKACWHPQRQVDQAKLAKRRFQGMKTTLWDGELVQETLKA